MMQSRKRRRLLRKQTKENDEISIQTTEDDPYEDIFQIPEELIDDTLSTARLFFSRNEKTFEKYQIPPVILWHQL